MEVVCENCRVRLNVPEEKIPDGKRAFVKCPKCKSRLSVSTGVDPEATAPSGVAEVNQSTTDSDTGAIRASEVDDSFLEYFEEGVKLALVMEHNPEDVEKIRRTIEDVGYRYVSAENTRAAVGKMRLHHFELVILSDQFDDMDLKQSPVMQYLNNLSMSIRRKIFVVLLSDDFKTLDNMMAFAMSANLVVNRRDLDKMTAILKQAVSENERFYKVFYDTLAEVGKA